MRSSITKRPLVICTVIFCSGIIIADCLRSPFLWVYIFALVFLLLSFIFLKKSARFDLFLSCLIFFFAAALLRNARVLPKSHIGKFLSYQSNHTYIVKGVVDNQPFLKNNQTSFIFKAEEIQSADSRYKTCGNILVRIKGRENLNYGEELLLHGNLRRPFSFGNIKRQSYRNYLYNQGIFSIMAVRSPGLAVKLNQNKALALKRLVFWLKNRMEEVIFQRLSQVAAGILDAMVLGEKKNISPLIYSSMIKSGTVHILVVSGFNTGIVSFLIILFLRLIRIPREIRFYLATPLLIIYCLMTGASNPVIRATVMAIVFMFAYLVRREADIYNSCALAALFILSIKPGQLFDVGFQLSFVSVLSLAYFYPRVKSFLRVDTLKRRYIRFFIEGCIVSFSAWLGTLAFIAYYFKIISPVTVLANIFIVPLASLVTLCGFSLIAAQLFCPFLAPYFAASTEFVVKLLLGTNSLLIRLPGAYFYLL
ncbi:MAG: ComEC/Rec2 family competence protein [Candidatus Omnitrophica bacterium]|nr:ComEC/Rec2 family competence protein [Candidatus Omnitrophota bacterium]MDD5592159.1 ComEC/Rec2 family competence protein [Candidatus Omnitrophota bacterium]